MIGMHIVDRDTRATGTQRRNRDIAQPNSLLIYTSIWIVLAKEVPRLVVPDKDSAERPTIVVDQLAQGVVSKFSSSPGPAIDAVIVRCTGVTIAFSGLSECQHQLGILPAPTGS